MHILFKLRLTAATCYWPVARRFLMQNCNAFKLATACNHSPTSCKKFPGDWCLVTDWSLGLCEGNFSDLISQQLTVTKHLQLVGECQLFICNWWLLHGSWQSVVLSDWSLIYAASDSGFWGFLMLQRAILIHFPLFTTIALSVAIENCPILGLDIQEVSFLLQ